MTNEEKRALWKAEEEKSCMTGWDFSYLDGRLVEKKLPWDYRAKVLDFLKPESKILDMGTGGGEFLLSLRHPFSQTCVTEAWEPNLRLCEKKLAPLGITVKQSWDDRPLPYDDGQFDLVLNRHESYDIQEVRRVLKPGGYFITQQVGGSNGLRLRKFICGEEETPMADFNLENEVPKFQAAGFSINYKNQFYGDDRYLDVGAFVWYMKVLPWEFPDFTVDGCFDKLLQLDALCEKQGYIPHTQHRFILIARKRK